MNPPDPEAFASHVRPHLGIGDGITPAYIAKLAADLATRGSKGPPMSAHDAYRQLARTDPDPRVRELAKQQLKRGVPRLNIGRRFEGADSTAIGPLYGDKIARRVHRLRARRQASWIEGALAEVRRRNADTRAMASNSHEARRAIDEDRQLARSP